jgi:hypothetical protein
MDRGDCGRICFSRIKVTSLARNGERTEFPEGHG